MTKDHGSRDYWPVAILTQHYLNQMTCNAPGCNETHQLYLQARCHEDAPPTCIYSSGVLRIECSVCKLQVCEIAVAP